MRRDISHCTQGAVEGTHQKSLTPRSFFRAATISSAFSVISRKMPRSCRARQANGRVRFDSNTARVASTTSLIRASTPAPAAAAILAASRCSMLLYVLAPVIQ